MIENPDHEGGSDTSDEPPQFSFPLIGVGASAGGLESLEKLFDQIRLDEPVSFVVVQHLSPDFKSMMDEILRRHTNFAVQRVEGVVPIVENTIYLNSPKSDLFVDGDQLRLVDRELRQGVSQPIDRFFKSLALQRQTSCAAVVLSGSGSDGSRGIRDVREHGGVVLAESPEHAKFDGMPRSAVDTGVVDFVGSAEQIATWIKRFVHSFHAANQSGERIVLPDGREMIAPVEGIQRVIEILREQCGIDFAKYKPNMIVRRIGRRLQLMHFSDINDYIERLETDPEELDQLYRDLLIGVTRFFRDPDAFQVLSDEVLPTLVNEANNQTLRIWTPGCATGEETYSLAITLAETIQKQGKPLDVKIFATDAHRHSLASAATGIYSTAQVDGVSAELLANYFQPTGAGYQVRQSIRKMIVFAPQNLLKDASFTNVDLVVCRNTLIYFDTSAQQRALGLMHFGLRTGGYLFLGPSETPGIYQADYETINRRWRFYKKVSNHKASVADLRSPDRDLSARFDRVKNQSAASSISDRMILTAIEGLAEEHLPPTFIIDADFRLLYSTAGASRFLKRQEGRFGSTLPELLVSGLKTNVLVGLQRCARQDRNAVPIVVGQIAISDGENNDSSKRPGPEFYEVKAVIRRVSLRSDELSGFCVTVLTDKTHQERHETKPEQNISATDLSAQQTLEEELRYTKESLQATIQELETSNEELQATNEEMVAANEELQSTNEELHSVNEELYTVNAEHQSKIEQLIEITEDMDNLFHSSNIATLFLDHVGNIRRMTPRAAEIFGLKIEDAGRNLANFRNPLQADALYEWIDSVNEDQEYFEQEVLTHAEERFLLRIHPYQSSQKQSGVVLNLISLQRLEEARRLLESNELQFRGTFENAAVGIAHVAFDGTWLRVNERLSALVGYSKDELLASDFQTITHPDDLDNDLELFEKLKAGDIDHYTMRKRYVHKNGSIVPIQLTVSVQAGRCRETPYCISIVQDASELSKHEKQLESAIQQRDEFLAVLSHELRNPLGAVTNALSLLKQNPVHRSDEDTRLLLLIDRQAAHMKSLVDDLLDTRRITAGEINLRNELQDLGEIARDCVEALRGIFSRKNQTIEAHFDDADLPVIGDKTRLLQVMENLLTNANRYTPTGGNIVVRTMADNGNAVLCVEDNGNGISNDQLERIFEMFARGEANRGTQAGLGVGLALSKMLVEKQQGELIAESPGKGLGATFTIVFPLVSDTSLAEREAARKLRHLTVERASATTIALVEDDDDARNTLAQLLQLDGHTVVSAPNGRDGIAAILEHQPSIALIDLSMPEMSGLEVVAHLRESSPDLPTKYVAITGHGQASDRTATEEAGFSDHLVKPIDLPVLNRILLTFQQ